MKIEPHIKQRIVKNSLLSLFIYILPLALMFATFYFTGQKPWEKKQQNKENIKPLINHKKNTVSNDIND